MGRASGHESAYAISQVQQPRSFYNSHMNIETFPTDDEVARAGAALVATKAREAIAARGLFRFAVSGGKTPWVMLGELGRENLPWDKIQIFQIDERIAPAGDPDRNLTHLRACL